MMQTFYLTVLEREVASIKQKHLAMLETIINQHFRYNSPPTLPDKHLDFSAANSEHISYLIKLYSLGCYLSKKKFAARLDRVYKQQENVTLARRSLTLIKRLAAVNIDIYTRYCQYHNKDVNQLFAVIKEKCDIDNENPKIKHEHRSHISYALTVRGTDYFLGHVLLSPEHAISDKDIKVAVMTKSGVYNTPRVTAVVQCTIRYIPDCHRVYRPFTILDTRGLGLYDFTILVNRVVKTYEDVKSILIQDYLIPHVITPVP